MMKWVVLYLLLMTPGMFARESDIFKSIYRQENQQVAGMLAQQPELANARNANGLTALHMAVAVRNRETVKLLLEKGALANCGDNHLRAPIHYANWNKDQQTIGLLLSHGAVIDTRAIGGATPLIHSSLGDCLEMSRFLIDRGADIHVQCNALTTPLYFAVLNGNLEYLDLLLKAGAEIDVPDFLGRTPLQVAVRDGNLEIAEKLLENRADLQVLEAPLKRTLLHIAAIRGHADMAELLLKRGLKSDLTDNNGENAHVLALRYGNHSVSRVLAVEGAQKTVSPPARPLPDSTHAQVVKLQNGSWAVLTPSSLLVMGYSETGAPNPDRSLRNGHITKEILGSGRSIYLMDHDFHPLGKRFSLQGSNPVLSWQAARKKIAFVLNNNHQKRYQVYGLENSVFPQPGEKAQAGRLKVTVLKSYGPNRCYLAELENLKIVWLTGICDNYLVRRRDVTVVQSLINKNLRPDVLFVGTPAGIGPEVAHGIRETLLELSSLRSKAVFVFGKAPLERKVRYQLQRKGVSIPGLICSSAPGDRFLLE